MLGKLIKHEWKSTYKTGCMLLGAVALITFFGWLAFQTPMWNSIRNGGSSRFSWLDLFGILTLVMYVVLLVVVNFGIILYVGVHFYKTTYTDEGYLLHTLPVTKHEILGSKILVGSLWVLFTTLTIYLSVFLLEMSMVAAILPKGYTFGEFWRQLGYGGEELFRIMGVELGLEFGPWVVRMLIWSLVTPFVTVTTLFGAVSIGQLASGHRVLMAILAYFGISILESMINSLIGSLVTMGSLSSFGAYVDVNFYSSCLVKLLIAVGLYFVSWYVASSKLNMN